MQKLSSAVQLGIGLVLGLVLGLVIVGSVNLTKTATTTVTTTTTTTTRTITVSQPVYEFFAGATSIQCEIVTNLAQQGPVPLNQITCFTSEPARSVALNDVGKINKCEGMTCLANPGLNTPYLTVGTKIVSGSHHCEVVVNGARCGNESSVTFTMTANGVTTSGQDPVLLQPTQAVYEFFGPATSGVECEMATSSMLCITKSPPRRAVLSSSGKLTTCDGAACLSDPGLGTPTLLDGTVVSNSNFTCTTKAHVTSCRAKDIGGFEISTAGISPAA
jgi:hypothetical protein